MINHTITLYPTLIKRLTARGWCFSHRHTWTKQRGKYTYLVVIDYAAFNATFSCYERLSK